MDKSEDFLRVYASMGRVGATGGGLVGAMGAALRRASVRRFVAEYFALHGALPTGKHDVESKDSPRPSYSGPPFFFETEFPGEEIARRVAAGELLTHEQAWKAIDGERAAQQTAARELTERSRPIRTLTPAEIADLAYDPGSLDYKIYKHGHKVAYQDWDSGGPGGGAGTVCVYKYKGSYYVFHDAERSGPYRTKEKAIRINGVATVNNSTQRIWDEDQGFVFVRS